MVLARLGFEEAPVVEPQPQCRFFGKSGGAVGRVVVGQDDLDRALIGELGDPLQGRHDRSSSFQAAITTVTAGQSPSGQSPRGGPAGRSR